MADLASVPDVLALPIGVAREHLAAAGTTVVVELEMSGWPKEPPHGAELRVVRQRITGEGTVALVVALFRPPAGGVEP